MVNKNVYENIIYLTGMHFRKERTCGHKYQ